MTRMPSKRSGLFRCASVKDGRDFMEISNVEGEDIPTFNVGKEGGKRSE